MRRSPFDKPWERKPWERKPWERKPWERKPWERRHPCLPAFGERAFHHSRPTGKAGRQGCLRSQESGKAGRQGCLRSQESANAGRQGCLRSQESANAGRRGLLRLQGAATLLFILLCGLHTLTLAQVRFMRGELEIPTYTFNRSETVAPLFKSADGGALYPYARLDRDSMSRKPIPVRYESLTLENEYLRVTLLPDLGGRIWSARDRVADREIFYTTSVIKPTTYNQRGGWPAGNLEVYGPYDAHMLTWPGEAWPWAFRRDSDGGATVILSHIDHFFRNKLSMEVTLRPGRSFIELKLRLRNDNALPNRYLLWTNAGVRATEGPRFVYPMTRTIAHVSSDIGSWPVAGGPDAGNVDISWYKNNKSMLGVFGLDLYDNFIAAYDYDADYGTICYANRMLARGVKTWTWGTGEAAMRQMAHYTDSDGPYVEVQSGRFVWDGNYEFIEPGKSDGWTEYWYGAGKLGGLTTASRDVAIFFDAPKDRRGTARLAVTATGIFANATLKLTADGTIIWSARQTLSPANVYHANIQLTQEGQIGRASCRERGAVKEVDG